MHEVTITSFISSFFLCPIVLFISDFLKPIGRFTIEFLNDRNMRHGCRRPGSMPNEVSGSDLFYRASPPLDTPAATCHDKRLAQRMRVPIRTFPVKVWATPFVEGLGTGMFDVHGP